MILPKDRTLFANLSTSFTGFGDLLQELASNSHSGFVRVSFPEYEGALFLLGGEVVHALEETSNGHRATGQGAGASIRARAAEKNGLINVDAASAEVVWLIAQVLDAEPLYKDLTSSFTSLERLFTKLQQDALTGFVEISLAGGAGAAMVLFQAGNPVESVFTSPEESLTGLDARAAVVHSVNTVGGTFNVFRARVRQDAPAPGARPLGDSRALLQFWSEVCAAIEEVADGLSSQGRFRMALREVLVSRANTYPFLDPFAAEFDYKDGTISFDGPVPGDFSKALGACLGDTVAKLAFQLKRADLENRVRAKLAGASERHAAVIQRWDLADDIREFVA
ncbi:MAG: hypothetical protein C0506_09135 [Anaerolinea sp.]|nr:hypothetical protein [Anaerolinea sp.]